MSSYTVEQGTTQVELSLPSITIFEDAGFRFTTTNFPSVVRYGLTNDVELRLGGAVYSYFRATAQNFLFQDDGFNDIELGVKAHLLDEQGARPSLAVLPSFTLPVGETGFSADDPEFRLAVDGEWTLADNVGVNIIAALKHGAVAQDDANYTQALLGMKVGRAVSPKLSVYGDLSGTMTDLDVVQDYMFVGGGLKVLASRDLQFDVFVDRGVTEGSPDWFFGLGMSLRF